MGTCFGKKKVRMAKKKGGARYLDKTDSGHSMASMDIRKMASSIRDKSTAAARAMPKSKQHQEVVDKYATAFADLGLNEFDVWHLYQVFLKMDFEKNQLTTADDTFEMAGIEPTPFTFRTFLNSVVLEQHGKFRPHMDLNFRQWVCCLWNYCTLSRDSIVHFAFSTYDINQNGLMTADELEQFTKELFGHGVSYAVPRAVVELLGRRISDLREQGAPMKVKEFVEIANANKALMLPAFNMQLLLQRSCGGERWWRAKLDARQTDALFEDTLDPSDWAKISKRIIRGAKTPFMSADKRRARGERRRSSVANMSELVAVAKFADTGSGGEGAASPSTIEKGSDSESDEDLRMPGSGAGRAPRRLEPISLGVELNSDRRKRLEAEGRPYATMTATKSAASMLGGKKQSVQSFSKKAQELRQRRRSSTVGLAGRRKSISDSASIATEARQTRRSGVGIGIGGSVQIADLEGRTTPTPLGRARRSSSESSIPIHGGRRRSSVAGVSNASVQFRRSSAAHGTGSPAAGAAVKHRRRSHAHAAGTATPPASAAVGRRRSHAGTGAPTGTGESSAPRRRSHAHDAARKRKFQHKLEKKYAKFNNTAKH